MGAVREPTPDDADRLGEIHVAAWRRAYRGGLMPDDYLDGLDPGERATMWAEALGRPPRPRCARLVAEDEDGVVAGFILVGPVDGDPAADSGEVFALNVAPESWGRGHGGALLQAGVAALAGAGFGDAVLWVHPANARARGFYERHGWTPEDAERLQDVLGVEVPEVRYRRGLARE